MSGILGFVSERPQTIHVGRLRRALRSLEQRGPDDYGVILANDFGTSRLFLDATSERVHSPASNPPAPNESATAMLACCLLREENPSFTPGNSLESSDGRVLFAFDGLIDNSLELNRQLQKEGYQAQSNLRLETLLAVVDQWGPDSLSRVTGSFAFAQLDLRRRSLILARDAFGTRPLYYSQPVGGALFFGSQISALLELTGATPRVNRTSLCRYLAHNIMDHAPETFFAGIAQIPAGHYLLASLDRPTEFSVTRYRRIAPARTNLTFGDAADCLRELVVGSVKSQVGTHEALGAAHSGGFDSSFVIAAFERAQPGAQLQLYTCLPVVKNGNFSQSEEAWADLAASGFRSTINKVRVSAEGLPRAFDALVYLQEEPFSSPVVFAQLQLFRAAHANGVRLMLSGQGGDTVFAGSTDHLLRGVLSHLRRGHLGRAIASLKAGAQLPQGSFRQLIHATARTVLPRALRGLARRFRASAHPEWLHKEWFELDFDEPTWDLGLPMLRFEDRNAIACAMVNRMPLLTVELQDFVRSLPPEYLVTASQPKKSIESAAMRGMVPDAVLARRERSGFPVPVREWLYELAPWVEMNITEIERLPFLEQSRVRQVWESVQSGNTSVTAAFLVWRWIFLAGWLRYMNVRLD